MTKDREQALLNCAEVIKTLLIKHSEFGVDDILSMALEIMPEEQQAERDGAV